MDISYKTYGEDVKCVSDLIKKYNLKYIYLREQTIIDSIYLWGISNIPEGCSLNFEYRDPKKSIGYGLTESGAIFLEEWYDKRRKNE